MGVYSCLRQSRYCVHRRYRICEIEISEKKIEMATGSCLLQGSGVVEISDGSHIPAGLLARSGTLGYSDREYPVEGADGNFLPGAACTKSACTWMFTVDE